MKAKLFIAAIAVSFSAPSMAESMDDVVARANNMSSQLCESLGSLAQTSLEKMSVNPQGVYEILMSDGDSGISWYDPAYFGMASELNTTTMQPKEFGLHWQIQCMKGAKEWINSMVSQ